MLVSMCSAEMGGGEGGLQNYEEVGSVHLFVCKIYFDVRGGGVVMVVVMW